MKHLHAQIAVFCIASAATAWLWFGVFSDGGHPPPPSAAARPANPRGEPIEIQPWLADLARADSAEARLRAARQLDRMPPEQIRQALDDVPLIDGHRLTLAAKLLLNRWASRDGEAAIDWAWMRFRSEPVWDEAFREIIAAWSWSQPARLGEWAKRMALHQTSTDSYIPLADAQQSEHPIMDADALRSIAANLMRASPQDAASFLLSPGGSRGWSSDVLRPLQSATDVREALLAFGDLDQLDWELLTDSTWEIDMLLNNRIIPETMAASLLRRWKELDPDDFARSRHAHLPPPPSDSRPTTIGEN